MLRRPLVTAVLGIVLAGAFGAAQASLSTVSAKVNTDTPTELDITWEGSLYGSFLLPTGLDNWDVPSLNVGTSSITFFEKTFSVFGAQIVAQHKVAPHLGETASGPTFDSGVLVGSFGQNSSYSAMADHNALTFPSNPPPANWTNPHWDHYSFSVNSAADGSAKLELKALHPVPEPETYAMLLAGLGVIGAIVRRRRR